MENMSRSGVTVVGSDAPSEYHVAVRTETPVTGSVPHVTPHVGVSPVPAMIVPPVSVDLTALKKKRGRPRKYGPDGSVTKALSPKPISSSAPPPVIDFSVEKPRGKVRPVGLPAKQHQPKMQMEGLGEWFSSAGANFTPHIVTVNAGEDVMMKIISFSQQGPRAICILSANGVISSVTLRQPDSSGGTLTYEGRFDILSLSGSFMPTEVGGIRNRSGGMSVSLAGPDGRIIGGSVAGLLVAACPVQIVIGSFYAGSRQDQGPKNFFAQTAAAPVSSIAPTDDLHGQQNSATPLQNLSATSLGGNGWPTYGDESRNKPTDVNVTLPAPFKPTDMNTTLPAPFKPTDINVTLPTPFKPTDMNVTLPESFKPTDINVTASIV
ncbi:AT-hook motif nuclear-localized protein 1-like [Apium graveolens]|uniref:AT-hook motif nuclear-localized protein 1-like n=1 Tax=Apium graveolens TaxID=4045 RepID=UPI003D7AD54C